MRYIPFPGRMLMTPGGIPDLATSSENLRAVSGVTCVCACVCVCVHIIHVIGTERRKRFHYRVKGHSPDTRLLLTSAGLRIMVFPAAKQAAIFQASIISG